MWKKLTLILLVIATLTKGNEAGNKKENVLGNMQGDQPSNAKNGDNSVNAKGLIDKIWKFELKEDQIDPNKWNADFKAKIIRATSACAFVLTQGGKFVEVLIMFLAMIGAVHSNWFTIMSVCTLYYGWKRKHRYFLAVGAVLTYCCTFGYSLLG